ncbi:MAG: SanA protein [Ruminococcaceae bacterium]|nr:SanA protein [Oscillospiraceae bacterium]
MEFKRIKNKENKLKKFISLALIVGVILAQIPILINAYIYEYASKYVLTVEETKDYSVDCVLVLGAGVRNGSPTPILQERILRSTEIFDTGCTDRILMSGDHGREDYDEVNTMKDFATDNSDVLATNILMDHAGFSTYESMYRAKEIFEVDSLIIVTQEYHLYRAIYDARRLGLEAYGVCADGYFNFSLTKELYNDSREFLARVKDFFWCIIKPEPTYLGEVIPISSPGEATDDKIV